MKKHIVIPIVISGFIGMLVGLFIFQTNKLDQALEQDQIGTIELLQLEDGNYRGHYESSLVSAQVEVQIVGHEITNIIILKHDTMFGKEAEVITDTVIAKQSLNVDDVAGATYSSEVIKRAIEDALKR